MPKQTKSDGDEPGFDVAGLCRNFSELSPQPMVAVEGQTHVVRYLNAAFARLVGHPRSELIGRPFAFALLKRASRCTCPSRLVRQLIAVVTELASKTESKICLVETCEARLEPSQVLSKTIAVASF